jgi:sigma-B regulation protein RsbU (phosphoserine phosphatase)
MNSISIRFALASVSIALFILAITGTINYLFLKKELLNDATQKAKLIEENSAHKIQNIITKTKESAKEAQEALRERNFKKDDIKRILQKTLNSETYFYGMAMAFEPNGIYKKPYSPYFYKNKNTILYKDLANKSYNYQTKAWYITPKNTKQYSWSEPYFDKGGGNILMATFSSPVIENKRFLGLLTIDLSLQELQKLISSIHILQSGYAFLLSKENKILVDLDNKKIMTTYPKKSFPYNQMIKDDNRWIYYAHIASTGLTLGIVLPHNELFSSLHKMSLISIFLAIVGSILLIVAMFIISRRISQPLKDVTALTQKISLGNFDAKIELPKTKDEIYSLSLAINRMQDSIKEYIQEIKTATIQQQKVESELNIAKEIQISMLPKKITTDETFEIEATLNPAKAVGGDFYDFFYIGDTKLCFVIADVSGKGVPAALFMSVSMSYIQAYTQEQSTPAEIVKRLNNTLANNNDANMFVTLFLAILDTKSRKLSFINAGHTNSYLISQERGIEVLEAPRNPVVGAFEDIEYKDATHLLKEDEKLFLYTDGVNEAYSSDDEQFGEQRLEEVLLKSSSLSAKESIEEMLQALTLFCKGSPQSDDITMLCIRYKKST